ncbi:MAG: hypothetical protein HC836_37665 [Richelia sp. RM2_1_2]|nr:hypothetical protein [Richelia sp. RM2_1_2]
MKFLLFTTPRTGSKYLYSILMPYMMAKYNAASASEYFNFEITNTLKTVDFSYNNTSDIDRLDLYNQELFGKLKNTNKFLFMKIFSMHVSSDVFNYLNDNYVFICLSRRNKLEQLLSFALSNKTLFWDVSNDNDVVKYNSKLSCYNLDKKYIVQGVREIKTYEFLLQYVKNIHTSLVYEDIIMQDPKELLIQLFPDDVDLIKSLTISLPIKQNSGDKFRYFSNRGEIISWFNNANVSPRIVDIANFGRLYH